MEATTAKIASEALKPVSSVIDALLSAKLQRIRMWAETRERSSRLGSGTIEALLDRYFRRLLRRVSGITTIVFPQQVLPLPSIYEPLTVSPVLFGGEARKPFYSSNSLRAGQNYVIVDGAGMGKSTFAKHSVIEILNSTAKLPIFLELRRISDRATLLETLVAEIDETQRDLDEALLRMLLDEGNFVIILDGFDEIADLRRQEIGKQITELALRCENNSLILTARPEVILPELPNLELFTILPLTRRQAQSLVLRYDAVAEVDVGAKLIEQFDLVLPRFLEVPLLVVLLYRTYGFNQSIATRISSFYDELYNALYKGHDLSKAGFARVKDSQLDSEEFRRLLRGFSFLLAARQKDNLHSKSEGIEIVDEARRLTSAAPATSLAFFDDLLLAVPLFVREGTDFRFIHRSIGEFFAAEFLAYQSNSEQIIERIREGHLYASFINSFQYLSEINPSLFRRFIVAPLAKAILTEVNPVSDAYIRTLMFLGDTCIGLWPYDKFTDSEIPNHLSVRLPEVKTFSTLWYSYGHAEGIQYVLSIGRRIDGERQLPSNAWEAISVEATNLIEESQMNPVSDFTGIEHILIPERWERVSDERVLRNVTHPAIGQALRILLAAGPTTEVGRDREHGLRVLSEKHCEDLLEEIQQEDETQDWLKSLISGSGKQSLS